MSSVHSDQQGPIALTANQPNQFYLGGGSIARLRGVEQQDAYRPEDWVASVTSRFGRHSSGLSQLPDGRLLRDAVVDAPETWLGPEHRARYGDSTALLVKLLDAGQRLPVHCHPSDQFAQRHLDSYFGKTEAWLVVDTTGTDRVVHLGFRDDVEPETIAQWVAAQDSSAMLDALNEIRVQPGDTLLVPAGTPHAIGSGVFVVELQQPTDFSITLEWSGFLPDANTGLLGMDSTTALRALNHQRFDSARLSTLIRHTRGDDDPRVPLLPAEADDFFQAERLHPNGSLDLEPSFGVLLTLDGSGWLAAENAAPLQLTRGSTVVIPYGAGSTGLRGDMTALYCRPPRLSRTT